MPVTSSAIGTTSDLSMLNVVKEKNVRFLEHECSALVCLQIEDQESCLCRFLVSVIFELCDSAAPCPSTSALVSFYSS
jgi:hypothetical protein